MKFHGHLNDQEADVGSHLRFLDEADGPYNRISWRKFVQLSSIPCKLDGQRRMAGLVRHDSVIRIRKTVLPFPAASLFKSVPQPKQMATASKGQTGHKFRLLAFI